MHLHTADMSFATAQREWDRKNDLLPPEQTQGPRDFYQEAAIAERKAGKNKRPSAATPAAPEEPGEYAKSVGQKYLKKYGWRPGESVRAGGLVEKVIEEKWPRTIEGAHHQFGGISTV
jgi:hypothetical protein